MVKYDSVSVGIAVKPESSPKAPKNLLLGLEYKVDMADFIITVNDNDVVIKPTEHPSDNPFFNPKLRSKKVKETFGTLNRISDYDNDDDAESVISKNSNDSPSTTRNRPRKSRSENRLNSNNKNSTNNNNTGNNITDRAYPTGHKNSTSTFKSCDYYRRKLYEEGTHPSPEYDEWLNLSTLQKTAGQKVVKKLADQQKILEAEAEQHRRKSNASNGSAHSSNNSNHSGSDSENKANFLPPKKKTTRLEPLHVRIAE